MGSVSICCNARCRFPTFYSLLVVLAFSSVVVQCVDIHTLLPEAKDANVSLSVRSARRSACIGTSGLVGTCYSRTECATNGGTADGPCAGGFGVVCLFTVTCGGTVRFNNTYFQNPSWPNTDSGVRDCSIAIQQANTTYTEYIINYQTGVFAPPDATGTCSVDVITSTNTAFKPTCGTLTGTSTYLQWGSTTQNGLNVRLGTGSNRAWRFLITQTKTGDCCYAPADCYDYYDLPSGSSNNPAGTFTSPGYDGTSTYIQSATCIRQCFRLPTGFCSVRLTSTGAAAEFTLTGTNGACSNTTDAILYPNMGGASMMFCGDGKVPAGAATPVSITVPRTGTNTYTFVDFCPRVAPTNAAQVGYRLMYTYLSC